jgi:iron complex transport system ATP-binding protein
MLLSVCHLTVRRNAKTLLDDVSFDVQKGDHLVVIGPNGAGKTTLLKCLDNILTHWTGNITFDGKPLQHFSQRQLAQRIAYVQQSASSPFAFTVLQLVEMGRYPHLKTLSPISAEDRQIVEEAMQSMGITNLADRTVHTLSGGEIQKVHLATALAQQADVWFLDEPTTYLDYKHQSEIGRLLRTFHQQGKTIIEVTHDANRAVLDATHVIALSSGRIVFDGSPAMLMNTESLRNIYDIDFQFVNHPSLPLKLVVPGV